jgi:hypothetical protein
MVNYPDLCLKYGIDRDERDLKSLRRDMDFLILFPEYVSKIFQSPHRMRLGTPPTPLGGNSSVVLLGRPIIPL